MRRLRSQDSGIYWRRIGVDDATGNHCVLVRVQDCAA